MLPMTQMPIPSAIARPTHTVAVGHRIARAQRDDFDVVAQLFAAARGHNAALDPRFTLADDWQNVVRDMFEHTYADEPAALWLLAWDGTAPVGLLMVAAHLDSPLLKHRRWAEVQALYLAPEYRGSGLAQQLIAQAHQWAAAQGFERVQVHAAAANEHARDFYRRVGFQPLQHVLSLPVPAYVAHAAA